MVACTEVASLEDHRMSAQTPMPQKRITAPEITARKGREPIVSLTSYHAHTAAIADPFVDFLLVGDSLGMVMHGYESTVPVPLELMIMHGRAVVRGAKRALVVVDMPFGSYEESPSVAFRNAAHIMKETGCGAVKLEGGRRMAETVRFLVERGIPVMAHIGLTPQSINVLGGFKTQGRVRDEWAAIEEDAKAVSDAGAFSIVLEAMAEELARKITAAIPIPDHRHRRQRRVRRADPGDGGHAGAVPARAKVRQGVRQGGRCHPRSHFVLCDGGSQPHFSGPRTHICRQGRSEDRQGPAKIED